MTISPLTPTAGDSETILTLKILQVLLNGGGGGGGAAMSSGPANPAFTPIGVTLAFYKNTTTGVLFIWDPVNGWE